jgi:hypothetical protein
MTVMIQLRVMKEMTMVEMTMVEAVETSMAKPNIKSG